MKKFLTSLLSTTLVSTVILGGGTVFAATSDTQGETSVTATLTLPNDKNVTPPTVPDPTDPNVPAVVPPTVTQQQGRGIVYYPSAQNVAAQLQETGEQDIALQSKIHVGVKDKLRQKDAWNLTATLNWSGANANDFEGVTIQGDKGTVQKNNGDGQLSSITNGVVTTNAQNLTISNTATTIMETTAGSMKDGVYDYSVENFRIHIPKAELVPAGQYTGTIDWNLAITPNP